MHLSEYRPVNKEWLDACADPDNESESSDAEVDPFEELGVQTNISNASSSDGLEAFMEDDEEEAMDTAPAVESEEEEDDDDVFATLGVAGPSVALASSGQDDILAAFMEDDDVPEEENSDDEVEGEPAPEAPAQPDAKAAYKMVLETVWVDGVLDPGEVNLLARKREDLGITLRNIWRLFVKCLGDLHAGTWSRSILSCPSLGLVRWYHDSHRIRST